MSAQETLVVGQVLNIADKSPIENVNVYFKNTNIGVKTSDEGYFMVRTTGNETTVVFSCVGYVRKEIKVKSGQSVGMQVEMREENTMLQEVFVVPGANPAQGSLLKNSAAAASSAASLGSNGAFPEAMAPRRPKCCDMTNSAFLRYLIASSAFANWAEAGKA